MIHFQNKAKLIAVICTVLTLITQACNCETDTLANRKTTIEILEPSGTTMYTGSLLLKVEDLDGLSNITVIANEQEFYNQDLPPKTLTLNVPVSIDLESLPETFTVKINATDIVGVEETLIREFRKDAGVPYVKFISPSKLEADHPNIFVGKNFKMIVEALDLQDGIKEIKMMLQKALPLSSSNQREPGPEIEIKTCTGLSQEGIREQCVETIDLSDDTEFSHNEQLSLIAVAIDTKDTPRDAVIDVLIDKQGPNIDIISPEKNAQIQPKQTLIAYVRDQAGVKKVQFFFERQELTNVSEDPDKAGHYVATLPDGLFQGGTPSFRVVAIDQLDNVSEKAISSGCKNDDDCEPNYRCCLGNSPTNPDGKRKGQCFPIQEQEGALCDPCTQPCGKGRDDKLMGCLPQPCTTEPPYRCRRACNLGNANRAADTCLPRSGNRPAEHCAISDITRINPSLGSCAIGHFCDPLDPRICPPGAKPPYNNCCPKGMTCSPADQDSNFCVPEGPKKQGETNCNNNICEATNTCGWGMICVTSTSSSGQPRGPSKCEKMCNVSEAFCSGGKLCTQLRLSRGNVLLRYGACTSIF